MSDFGVEFPRSVDVRQQLLDTLMKLDIYKPELYWEDIIMEAYNKAMVQSFGKPNVLIVSPNTFKNLPK